jgi:sugar lactone lactonase YvrE
MTRIARLLLASAVALVAAAVPAAAHQPPGPARYPAVVTGSGPALYPEGVTWDPARGRMLVGSGRSGTVSVVAPDGRTTPLVTDPTLISTFGLAVDARRHRLLVTYGDIGVGSASSPETIQQRSGLLIADLATGRTLAKVQLGSSGPRAANDVAVGPDGTAYVTDTLGDAVYRVDVRGRILGVVADPRFASESFGVNGIVWDPRGFVVTTRYDTGQVFRISPDGRRVDELTSDASLAGADGLLMLPGGTLQVITNALGGTTPDAVHRLRPVPGGWHEVSVTPWPDPVPTTAALTSSGVYVLSGRLDRLQAGDPSVTTFTLRRAD